MKKHLLFLPDIFLVMLIVFSCERVDLSEWRRPSDTLAQTTENTTSFPEVALPPNDTSKEVAVWKDYLADYREKAKSIFSHFLVQIGEN